MHRSAIKKILQRSAKKKIMRPWQRCRFTFPWSGLVRPTVPVLAAQAVLPWWGTGADCTGFYFFGGAPVLAAQVYSQCGEYSGPSQSSGHVFFSFGMAIFFGGGNVFIVLATFWTTG